ncbi:hypothetical protein [Bifidobacterium callitrichos]|uniref:ABC transporter ATP-binding protein n=1 Tax=Bifidobacterium callitrichos DSM 23973 TaxID=1437609 RepID=A0A087A9R9_9BIFI|nr:hypothetical protein [Bifidobacterium callitrichos]KFI55519.1 ABC transporter ATP-binding protein [Bifidobacterium callitrichos DSM 23973]
MQQPSILTLNGIAFTYPNAPEPLFDSVNVSFPTGWSAVLDDNGIVVSHDATLIDRTCGRCVVFSRRHVVSHNVTVVDTYPGGYVQVSAWIAEERESDASHRALTRAMTR